MKMLLGTWKPLQCLVFIGITLAIADRSEGAEPKRGGSLRFGVSRNLASLNPFVLTQSVDYKVRGLVYEGLLGADRNLEPLPALATSWAVSADGMAYTFTLRPGVKFHDGKPLSPADVKWSIEYAQDPKNGAFGRADLTLIGRVDSEEPNRLRIHLKYPFAPFVSSLSTIGLFPVVPQGSLQAGTAVRNSLPPGTGPFRFVEWRPGQELRLARAEEYWQKGLPYLDAVRFLIVTDDTVRLSAVRVGDLEIAEEIPEEQIVRVRDGKVPEVRLALAEAGGHPRIAINHCHPPFNNIKVRQAVAYALDKREIIDGAFAGLGTPTNQKLLRGTKWFVPEVPDRKQDTTKARALLAEAGYAEGLKITVVGSHGQEKELQVIQAQLRRAGIELTMRIVDYATKMAAFHKGEVPMSRSGGTTGSDPDQAYYAYYRTPDVQRPGRGALTQPCYSNPRVDRLLEEARRITDFQQRRRMYREVIEILQEEVADIPIAFVPNGFALQSHVRDFEPAITQAISYANGGLLKTWIDQ
jgi:peptide/nickel transport system substrate-binding protein